MTQIKSTAPRFRNLRPSAPSAAEKSGRNPTPLPSNYAATLAAAQSTAELLLLPDGRILAHNLTPALAALLADLDPADPAMRQRAHAPATRPRVSPQDPPSS